MNTKNRSKSRRGARGLCLLALSVAALSACEGNGDNTIPPDATIPADFTLPPDATLPPGVTLPAPATTAPIGEDPLVFDTTPPAEAPVETTPVPEQPVDTTPVPDQPVDTTPVPMVATTAKVFVANDATLSGSGSIDVWMGEPGTGALVATVASGTISAELPVQVPVGSASTGQFSATISLMPTGETAVGQRIMKAEGTWSDNQRQVLLANPSRSASYINVSNVTGTPQIGAGKAAVYAIDLTDDGWGVHTNVIPGADGECYFPDANPNFTVSIDGQQPILYPVNPGTRSVAIYSALFNCEKPLGDPTTISAAAGDQFVIFRVASGSHASTAAIKL